MIKINKAILYLLFILVFIGISYACEENWLCTEYGNCQDKYQYRNCSDANNCGTIKEKPSTAKFCTFNVTEPETCGNGRVDQNETYFNCNKDIRPTIEAHWMCVRYREKCAYYDEYSNRVLMYIIFGVGILAYIFWPRK